MSEKEMFPPQVGTSPADVMVVIPDDGGDSIRTSFALATELRAAGIRTDLFPVSDMKSGAQFKYGSSREIPFAVVPGNKNQPDEVLIKNLTTREEFTVNRKELVARLRNLL
jgi:histidyl-tRNA synthetase